MKRLITIYKIVQFLVISIMVICLILLATTLLNIYVVSLWVTLPIILLPFILFLIGFLGTFFYFLIGNIKANYYHRKAIRLGKKAEKELQDINKMFIDLNPNKVE